MFHYMCMGFGVLLSLSAPSIHADPYRYEPLKQCVALRGNGNWIGAHFGALARIVDDHQNIDALAGGSSATVTALLYESMTLHPAVKAAAGTTSYYDFISLMLKSVYGYMDAGNERLAAKFRALQELRTPQHWQSLDTSGLASNLKRWFDEITTVEQKFDLTGLLNPNFTKQLHNDELALAVRLTRATDAIATLQEFKADNLEVFFREGPISFAGLANFVGRFADFYAGRFLTRSQLEAVSSWLHRCGTTTRGLSWRAVSSHHELAVQQCAVDGIRLLDQYFETYNEASDTLPHLIHRIDETVGAYLPVLISTALVKHQSAADLETALARYDRDGILPTWQADFNADVWFGYWGPLHDPRYLRLRDRLQDKFPDDLKSQKYAALQQISWRDALQVSPAEPGLSRAVALPLPSSTLREPMYSVGGWSDLQPVQALAALGCDHTIYVTRFGVEADLATGASALLGANPKTQVPQLYSIGTEQPSSYRDAVRLALGKGAVWCTSWHKFGAGDIAAMSEEAYNAPVFTRDPLYLNKHLKNIVSTSFIKREIPGCTEP